MICDITKQNHTGFLLSALLFSSYAPSVHVRANQFSPQIFCARPLFQIDKHFSSVFVELSITFSMMVMRELPKEVVHQYINHKLVTMRH